jgi:hypothetical protein
VRHHTFSLIYIRRSSFISLVALVLLSSALLLVAAVVYSSKHLVLIQILYCLSVSSSFYFSFSCCVLCLLAPQNPQLRGLFGFM